MAKQSTVPTPIKMATFKKNKKKSGKLNDRTIVQILPALNHGGVERGTLEMTEAILEAGGHAVVISSGGLLERKIRRMGADHIQMPISSKNPFQILANRRRIKKLLATLKPDLVHIRSRAPAWSALRVTQKMGIPVITTIHGRFKAASYLKRIYNKEMTKADHIIAISHYIEGLVKEQFPQTADRLTVIHRGVDIDLFNPLAVTADRLVEMAEQLAIPDDVPVIMLPGRPTTWKGMSTLIEAMGMIRDKTFVLLLVGAADGTRDLQDDLTKQIAEAGITEKARLTPSVTDMPAAMMLADVVVMPSTSPEPFGRIAVEASAMGCPVVAFNHGGAVESVIPGVTGWLAEPGNTGSLADAVKKALGLGKIARQKLALESRNHIEKRFTSKLMCQSTIKLYLKVM
jgi:glycosyltransferase involved in cell wall biosynthesis